jgi:hypothetical protein
MSAVRSLSGANRTWRRRPNLVENEPEQTFARSHTAHSEFLVDSPLIEANPPGSIFFVFQLGAGRGQRTRRKENADTSVIEREALT